MENKALFPTGKKKTKKLNKKITVSIRKSFFLKNIK